MIKLGFSLFILIAILVFYFRSMAMLIVINRKSLSFILKQGLFRREKYKNFSEIKSLELKTYDVPASASPFEKSNREYIAEIRLLFNHNETVDLMNFERRSSDEILVSQEVFELIQSFTGIKSEINKL